VRPKGSVRAVAASTVKTGGESVVTLRPMMLAACLCALLTLPTAWHAGEQISSDGLSYLDIASNAIERGPLPLLTNGYWSPGYPALLAAAMTLVHPSPVSELTVVHVVDWLTCVAGYFSFTYFLLNFLKWIQLGQGAVFESRAGFFGILTFAYSLLLVAHIYPFLLWRVRPDLLLECVVYLAAGVCIRLSLPGSRLIHYAVLGAILALAYAVKAAFFPLSLVLLVILFIWPVAPGAARKGTVVATLAFLLATSPIVAILSFSKGRLTFGDTGRLNYVWYVNAAPDTLYWDGRLPESDVLLHPPRKISTDPVILNFEGPVKATWSLWYDPSYWYDGVQGHFDLRQQIRVLYRSLRGMDRDGMNIIQLASMWLPIFGGIAAFAVLGLRIQGVYLAIRRHIWLLLWPAFVLVTYACVHIEYRFLVSFIVLAWTTLFVAAWTVLGQEKSVSVTLTVAAALLLTSCPEAARQFAHDILDKVSASRRGGSAGLNHLAVASRLEALGIRRGDNLATVDLPPGFYEARMLGARFTLMLVGDPVSLSKLPELKVRQIIATLRANGAKALFSPVRPAFENGSGWVAVTSQLYVLPLQ